MRPLRVLPPCCLLAALLAANPALAQNYRFPGGDADYSSFYPTAYKDHSGQDWSCGDFQYAGHNGTDFGGGSWTGMNEGRDIVAAAVGVVTAAHDGEFDQCTTADCPGGGGFGNYVQIVHPDGKSTVYGHLKKGSVAVSEGQFVACGTLLGLMGSSGHSTGPHLHFGVKSMSGVWQDPFFGPCASPPSFWVDQGDYKGLPSTTCDGPPPPCSTVELITCGAVVQSRNDAPGSTNEHGHYGCGLEWVYSGPELGYRFVTDKNESVTLDLTHLTGDLSVHVVETEACEGSDCIGYSDNSKLEDEQVVFQAVAGKTYVIMLDGFKDATSDFRLSIDCTGGIPGAADAGPDGPLDANGDADSQAADVASGDAVGEANDAVAEASMLDANPDAAMESGGYDATVADAGPEAGGGQHDAPSGEAGEGGAPPAVDAATDAGGCGCAAAGAGGAPWAAPLAALMAALLLRRRGGRELPRRSDGAPAR